MRTSLRRFARVAVASVFVASAALACALRGDELVPSSPVTFKGDALTPEGVETLGHVAKLLGEKKEITLLRVEGHADPGTPDAQALSEKRAQAVTRWLVTNGVDCKRLLPVGFGAARPSSGEASPERRASNPAITFIVVARAGQPLRAGPVDGGGHLVADPCSMK